MSLSKETQLRVWIQNGWRCQLSGAPIIFPPVMRLFERIAGRNPGYWDLRYRYDHTPLLAVLAGTVDHKVPRSGGGSDALNNLQAACNAWNISKSNRKQFAERFSFWRGKRKCAEWDGFFRLFWKLYDPQRHADPYLRDWHQAVLCLRSEMKREGTWPYE